ncbi:cytochrome c oxidase subunit 3 [Buchnera aphidicola (Takecallis taiwana)]|uniref:cytochrome c oxidase subunit 3 n=1 Tax=Buchnera aphidicola TaxID=9 RepID=UPI0031B69B0D
MNKDIIQDNTHDITHDLYNLNNSTFGFWLYLMSDGILFATMFAVYCVMSINVVSYKNIFNLSIVFLETLLLLLSSISCGILVLSVKYKKLILVYVSLFVTFLCGVCFVTLEVYEFLNLIQVGYLPQRNGFLSAFFSLISLHGIHVIFGLCWMLGLSFHIHKLYFNNIFYIRIVCFSLFWHFLDIIWICIFTIIYLMGNIL